MLTVNPFAELSAFISPAAMQTYVILMVLAVIAGTIIDMIHKKSAKYFFENAKKAQAASKRSVESGEKVSLAVKTVANEVLTSGEFQNPKRRISHLFTMYGFILFVLSTAVMIFKYASTATATPAIWPLLWHLGALSVMFGGYWFWFFIRVDVSAEAHPWYKLVKADLFILSLLMMTTFALIWSFMQGSAVGGLAFAIFLIASTVLFTTVIWSKFAHMFFKPAAAYQKRVTRADESRENLPAEYDLTDSAVQAKFPDIPEYMGNNPEYMGHGIRREAPRHY